MNLLKNKILVGIITLSTLGLVAFSTIKEDYFEITKQIEIFTTLYKTVSTNYVDQTNPTDLMNKAIKNMLTELDPYTVYFNEQEVIKFKLNSAGEYTGIGAMISRKDGKIILKEPYKGYAADKVGLKAGDEIYQIGDIRLEDYKEDVSTLLKGAKNAKKEIFFTRQGKNQKVELQLEEVDIKAVPFYDMVDEKTGYIVLSAFNAKTTTETKNAIIDLKAKGATQLILDLRGNPGGLLMEAVNICNLFVPKDEVIVTTKSKNEKYNITYKTRNEPLDLQIPLAVIIDGKSASASEIVSGALQDLDRAVIVGSRSFGKGLVQRPIDLTYGTQVKVTISRYYTPSGRCIQALDYANKDASGKAQTTNEKDRRAFKTKKGRTVYDGGGIQPDIELQETKTSTIANALTNNDAIFQYASQWYYKNPSVGDKIPLITAADWEDFKAFIKKEKLTLNTETETSVKKIEELAKKEEIHTDIQKEYQALLAAVQKSNELQMEKHQDEIKKLLVDELIKRYQYREGLYAYYAQNSAEVKKAKELLNNISQIKKILQN